MTRHVLLCAVGLLILTPPANAQKPISLEQVMSAPFPSNLTAAKKANRIAWTLNQEGRRNIWVAEGPAFSARQLTKYNSDDGQELSDLSFSADSDTIVFVRGEGKNSAGQVPNPTSNPAGTEQAVWTVAWSGGEPRRVDAGHSPQISELGMIAYAKDGQIWIGPLDGTGKPHQLFVRGQNSDPQWSPDGSRLAFVSARTDHSFIAVYDVAAKTVQFMSPSVDSDRNPAWSLDGKHIAFVRRPAEARDAPQGFFIAADKPHPWAIWIADAATGSAKEIWHSSTTPEGSYPYMAEDTGGGVINWAAGNQLVVASEQDGWQHLYALSSSGGTPKLLTPGSCEVEQWSLSPDKSAVLFNSNCGDVDRRHLWNVSISGNPPAQWTRGEGLEWSSVILSDGQTFAYLASDATHPARPVVSDFAAKSRPPLAPETWPKDFPFGRLVVLQQGIFKSGDGLEIHSQLFVPAGMKVGEKRPALIFLHGGPIRQMLLGWHYMYYYSNSYAMNQYLASRGYIVLALNYRSGIGYGRAFREAPGRAGRGTTEYQDVVAAGKYLQSLSNVDPKRIGLWGGSYGGYLTALGLGRNSDLFAADLVARLREKGVEIEQLVFPDDVHDFLLHRNWLAAYHAASDFFDRHLKAPGN